MAHHTPRPSFLHFLIAYVSIGLEYRRLRTRLDTDSVAATLARDGVVIIPDFVDANTVRQYLTAVPPGDQLRLSPEGTMTRFLENADRDPILRPYFENAFIEQTVRSIIGSRVQRFRSIAQRRNVVGRTGAFEQFFHFDTWRHRIKAFLYLVDVDHNNGPLVYAPRTQRGRWRWKDDYDLFTGTATDADSFLHDETSQFLGTYLPHQSSKLFRRFGITPVEIVGTAGTLVMFDARGLHRVKPILDGHRVILSSYWIREHDHT